jgi:hypothetical protein
MSVDTKTDAPNLDDQKKSSNEDTKIFGRIEMCTNLVCEKPFQLPYFPLNFFLPQYLIVIIHRIIKLFLTETESQHASRTKLIEISSTPTFKLPLRTFRLSPVLNN